MRKVTEFFSLVKYDYGFSVTCYGENPGIRTYLSCFFGELRNLGQDLICKFRGHNFELVDVDVENGTEDIQCSRCGMPVHAQF